MNSDDQIPAVEAVSPEFAKVPCRPGSQTKAHKNAAIRAKTRHQTSYSYLHLSTAIYTSAREYGPPIISAWSVPGSRRIAIWERFCYLNEHAGLAPYLFDAGALFHHGESVDDSHFCVSGLDVRGCGPAGGVDLGGFHLFRLGFGPGALFLHGLPERAV